MHFIVFVEICFVFFFFFFLMIRRPPRSTLFPTRRSSDLLRQQEYDASDLLRWSQGNYPAELLDECFLPRFLFAQQGFGVSAKESLLVRGQILAGEDEDGKIGGAGAGAPLTEEFETTSSGQHQIEEYEFRFVRGDLSAGLRAIRGRGDGVTLRGQHFNDELAGGGVIFDDQDGARSLRRRVHAGATLKCCQESGLIHRFDEIFVGTE